jgi:hypothetical protein
MLFSDCFQSVLALRIITLSGHRKYRHDMQSFLAAGGGGLARLAIAVVVFASVLVAAFVVSGASSNAPGTSLSRSNGADAALPGLSSSNSSTTQTTNPTTGSVTTSSGQTSQTLLVSTQTGLGLVVGKVTIVLCPEPAVVNATSCQVTPDMYSTRQLVLTASGGGVVNIPLNPDGTFSAQVPPGSYQVSISSCNFLGCNLPTPSSISLVTSTTTVSVCFNCGPR